MKASEPVPDFETTPLQDGHVDEVLRVLSDTFGVGFDLPWFRWKHRNGPWGPSPGWVALDSKGIVGVRLFLPWRFRDGDETYFGLRPCDTVTVERARSRGVFRALTEHAVSELKDRCDLFFNTPNESSTPGYLKMGFTEWTRVRQYLGVVVPQRSQLTEMYGLGGDPDRGMSTDVGPAFLEWRYGRCPRYQYRMSSLHSASGPTGFVYRIRRGRWGRVLVVSELWGTQAERGALIRAVSAVEGVRLVWVAEQDRAVVTTAVSRGWTLVTQRPAVSLHVPRPTFSVGDIEDVI